jgi:hypothetical protein
MRGQVAATTTSLVINAVIITFTQNIKVEIRDRRATTRDLSPGEAHLVTVKTRGLSVVGEAWMSTRENANGMNCIEALLSIQSSATMPLEFHRVEDTTILRVSSIARRRRSIHTTPSTTSSTPTMISSQFTVMGMPLGREMTESTLHVRSFHVRVAQNTLSLPSSLKDRSAQFKALEDLTMSLAIPDLANCKRCEDKLPTLSSLLHRDSSLSTLRQAIT